MPLNLPDFTESTPRAVAMDLDETALNSDSRLDARTRAAIHSTAAIGIPVVIATSRPERVLPTLVGDDVLDITSLVQMNGTVATGRAGVSGSLRESMDLNDARLCWELVNQTQSEARMTMEIDGTLFAVNHDDDIDELWAFNSATPTMVVSFEKAMTMDPVKISVNGLEHNLEELALRLESNLSERTEVIRAGRVQFLNIVPKAASKSGAVAHLLLSERIELSDVLSFGDDYVDLELIRDCGWSVAVENAIPEIKTLAKFQTASNDDHGVAIVLENLVAALQ